MIDDRIDEQQEWLSALESVVRYAGVDRAVSLIQHLIRLLNQHAIDNKNKYSFTRS